MPDFDAAKRALLGDPHRYEPDPSDPATREATGSERPSLDDLARLLAEGMAGEVEKINVEAVAAAAEATMRAASWWEAAKEWYRVFDRQQKKLAVLDAERELAARRADAAEAKLREIAAALAVSDNDKAVPYEYLTDTVRAVLRDGPPTAEPVTDREEPAYPSCAVGSEVELPPMAESRIPKGPAKVTRYDRSEPASAWDVEADTHRISADHEEPAGRVVTGLAMVDACERCTGSKASEEPVGETKPRERLFGFELPEYIGWTEMNGTYQATCVWEPEKVKFSPLFNEDSTSHLAKFLNLHRHSQPVERQADSEVARADAWARECEERDDREGMAAVQAEEAAYAIDGLTAYDMDPDIDELDDEEADHG